MGFAKAANGIIGLEIAVASTYSVMVLEEGMSVEAWAKAWWEMPRKVLSAAVLADLDGRRPVTRITAGEVKRTDIASFASLSRNCPYDGMEFDGWPIVR